MDERRRLLTSSTADTSAEWYGVKFTGSATTGERTGCLLNHVTLPLQSQMRGCLVYPITGEVAWLNNTWTAFEDGTELPTTSLYDKQGIQTMVYVPDYYLLFIHIDSDDSDEIRIATEEFEGSTLIKGGYIGAYEGVSAYLFQDSSTFYLQSTKGSIPTVSRTRDTFESEAKKVGEGFHAYTYAMHKAITWLFVVEYACRNTQAPFNAELTPEGYHQGGLGEGVTTGPNNGNYSFVPCGTTDSLGNGTGIVLWQGTSRTYNVPRYRGIENPFGHIWKNTVDTLCVNSYAYVTDDPTLFARTTLPSDLSRWTRQDVYTSYKWIGKLTETSSSGDLFADASGEGSSSTYYCDYFYGSSSSSPRTVLFGGRSSYGSGAGMFGLHCYFGVAYSNTDVGSRLVYLPS